MDEETINMIKDKITEIKVTLESAIDQLDGDAVESLKTGLMIIPDFDDTDLTNVQASVDDAFTQLQDLSITISTFLTN